MIPTCCSILLAYYYCIRSFPYLLWDRKPPPIAWNQAQKSKAITDRLGLPRGKRGIAWRLPDIHVLIDHSYLPVLPTLSCWKCSIYKITFIYLYTGHLSFLMILFCHINLSLASGSSSHNSHIYNLLKQFQFLLMRLIISPPPSGTNSFILMPSSALSLISWLDLSGAHL